MDFLFCRKHSNRTLQNNGEFSSLFLPAGPCEIAAFAALIFEACLIITLVITPAITPAIAAFKVRVLHVGSIKNIRAFGSERDLYPHLGKFGHSDSIGHLLIVITGLYSYHAINKALHIKR